MRPRHLAFDLLVFDFDGTLADSAPAITKCLSATLQAVGHDRTPAAIRATIGKSLRDSIRSLRPCSDDELNDLAADYRRRFDRDGFQHVVLFNDVVCVLDSLASCGADCALVSNKGDAALRRLLEQLRIEQYFKLILSGDDVRVHKPERGLYDEHIRPAFHAVTPDRILVIGDTDTDISFAANIGARSCWASYGYGDAGVCAAMNPTFSIPSITELPAVVGLAAI